jgi:hypothetical protein
MPIAFAVLDKAFDIGVATFGCKNVGVRSRNRAVDT